MTDLVQTIQAVVPVVTPLIFSAITASAVWLHGKIKFHQIRTLIDDIDDAVKDDTVTEAEFQKIWSDAKATITKTSG